MSSASGEENIRFTEAVSKSSIEYVLTRHEQGASFMAEVYGRLTGRAGVCSATLGPGAINLLLGVATQRRIPLHFLRSRRKSGWAVVTRSRTKHRPRLDVRAGDEVVRACRDAVGRAGDGPEGVQARPSRAPRRGLSRSARGRGGSRRPAQSSPFPSTCPGPTIPPPHSSSVLPRFCAGRAIPSCWPVTGGPQRRAEAVRRFAESLDIPWRRRSTARALCPTTIGSRSAPSASCAMTM